MRRVHQHALVQQVQAQRFESPHFSTVQETLAEETPIGLVYNASPHAVMMASPADLEDFAVGFSLTEGIVEQAGQVRLVDTLSVEHGISVQMLIPQGMADALDARQRVITGRSGCGLCGTSTLAAAIRPVRQVSRAAQITTETLFDAFARLQRVQPANHETGAVHAAGALLSDQTLLVREDVGRHNAVDKVLGAAARQGAEVLALLVTSRASYEIIHKAAQVNCPIVAAISAPTALAVRLAIEANITLAGFTRAPRLNLYSWPERLRNSARVDAL